MVFTHDFADAVGGLLVRLVGCVAHLVHAEEHATVDGLHAVAHVGKGSRHYNRHRIVDIGRLHFVFDIDFKYTVFFQHICDR